jgi:Tol biopolymer transport system component
VPENLVSFPATPRVSPAVSRACAVFLGRWNGADVGAGARQLSELLPEHVPGSLKLVILRALRQIDVPPFPSVEAFREAIGRFAAAQPELKTLADVRRARRETRNTLDGLARQASLPVYMLRQLEWGDFRQWHNAAWSERVARAYARAAGLDPERVVAIVEEERQVQVSSPAEEQAHGRSHAVAVIGEGTTEPAGAIPLHSPGRSLFTMDTVPAPRRRSRRLRQFGLAAASVAMFIAGLGVGGAIVEQRSARAIQAIDVEPPAPQVPTPISAPRLPELTSAPAIATPSSAHESPVLPQERLASGPTADVADNPPPATVQPRLMTASAAGAPAFSPSFSNVGSAVFYHRDEGVGTALVKADRDEATGDLRIINIVEDNARNYHVRPSPDGSLIAFDSDRDGERGVYVANADGTGVRRVSGPGFAAVPSWSPDGTLLAFVRAERDRNTWNLWLLNLQTNETRKVTDYRYGQPWGASWFPDGRRVAYSHEDRLTVLDLPTGTKRIFKSPREGRLVRTPAVSPDGRHIVFQVYRDGAWMLDLRDSSMERILADPTAEEFAWDSTGHRLAFHSRRSGNWSVWIMAGPSS